MKTCLRPLGRNLTVAFQYIKGDSTLDAYAKASATRVRGNDRKTFETAL